MFTIVHHKLNHKHQKNFLSNHHHTNYFFTNFINTKSIDYTHHYSYFTCMQDMRALVRELVLGRLSTLCYTCPPRRNTCGLCRNFPSCTRGLPWRDLFGAERYTFDGPLRTLEEKEKIYYNHISFQLGEHAHNLCRLVFILNNVKIFK